MKRQDKTEHQLLVAMETPQVVTGTNILESPFDQFPHLYVRAGKAFEMYRYKQLLVNAFKGIHT